MMNKALVVAAGMGIAGSAVAGTASEDLDASFTKEKSFWDHFSFGSYGEFHANFGDGTETLDLHRAVLFADVHFTDKLELVTETEIEHLVRKKEGSSWTADGVEFKIEQAYFNYALTDQLAAKAGLIILPVGVINEVHEPTTFFGVERPNVEKYILPTTWTELGGGVVKTYDTGWQIDALVHSGLDMEGDSIRGGRSGYEFEEFAINGDRWAATTRVKYTGIAGVELAGSAQYQSDVDGSVDGDQDGLLLSTHGIYRKGGFQFVGLAAYWNLDVEGAADEQWGGYLEPSYTWETPVGKIGVFGRASQYEYFTGGALKEVTELNAGVNYWLTENIVLKADYLNADQAGKPGTTETYNVGFGWYF
ncbi:hypothetical protein [Sulfuriroseicoccus oceanibius]|uniref:Uncharacterized protein n=1 Tax=Sulfuriroseicoccus oceanibius TaxID=2707525 RepID=A0A6B3LA93_9BACT|nr:hypothetical protein [Sulfuriroseicoccus oceanibius]QQL44162.1 hypothetical protein G3M56_009670 [Sulfuriroseicoccus oceanibius]